MIILLSLTAYFLLIIIHSIIYPYIKLNGRERVEQNWITWTDNFKWNHHTIALEQTNLELSEYIHYRIDIQIVGCIRWLFNKPLKYSRKWEKKIESAKTDANGLSKEKYFKYVKKFG